MSRQDSLTPRQQEVLALLREGLSNEEIAKRLAISVQGAKYHVSEILSKLGLENRADAARWQPETRRAWWAVLLAPLALGWRKAGAAIAAALVVGGVAAGAGAIVWGMARTDNVRLETISEAPEAVWESGAIVAHASASCGDARTSQDYGAPVMLEIVRDRTIEGGRVLLGLEAEPYAYRPAQVNAEQEHIYGTTPSGWEVSIRSTSAPGVESPNSYATRELFLRRLDQPQHLFRYWRAYCNQIDGSTPNIITEVFPPASHEVSLPGTQPKVVTHRGGDFLSLDEALALYPGLGDYDVIQAELGDHTDLADMERTGLPSVGPCLRCDQTAWGILLAVDEDGLGPLRANQEYGFYAWVGAQSGDPVGLSCCVRLLDP